MIVGAHLRNEPNISPVDWQGFQRAKFEGAVVWWYQNPALFGDVLNPAHSIVRLPDSVVTEWLWNPVTRQGEPHDRIMGDQEYAELCEKVIREFYPYGFRAFQVDNEPNITWPAHGQGRWNWVYFMNRAMFHEAFGLRRRIAQLPGVTLGGTPLAGLPDVGGWYDCADQSKLFQKFDWLAAHCYWQREIEMTYTQLGSFFQLLWERYKLPIVVTECGNSLIDKAPTPSLDEIALRQAIEYPKYAWWASNFSYVRGIYFFMLGGTKDWAGFDLHSHNGVILDNLAKRSRARAASEQGPGGGY